MLISRIPCSVGLWEWTECLGPLLSVSESEQWPAKQAPWGFVALRLLWYLYLYSRSWYPLEHTCTSTIVLAAETALYDAVPYSN